VRDDADADDADGSDVEGGVDAPVGVDGWRSSDVSGGSDVMRRL
jgi:hypothetical protein